MFVIVSNGGRRVFAVFWRAFAGNKVCGRQQSLRPATKSAAGIG
jgi:hypothetical protein